jgi:hypothetical protein
MALLNCFSKATGNLKFRYDHYDSKWVDLDSIIATVTLTYMPESCFYKLGRSDADNLNEFVSKQNG